MKHDEKTRVLSNGAIAEGIYRMVLSAPEIAAEACAGQFVHVRCDERPDQFVRMPFTVYDADPEAGELEIVYQVVGGGTAQLAGLAAGAVLDTIGPLGTGWAPPEGAMSALVVGGGVGTPALNLLARALRDSGTRVDAVIGAATKAKLCCIEPFSIYTESSGGGLYLTTDDGTFGVHGFVTKVTDELIATRGYDYVAICGPTPMMANAVKPALENGTLCQVSMETLMGCGVGACFSCVVDTREGKKRCCVDGPVFDAREVAWR